MSQSTTYACTNCHASVPTSMSFCPNCGTPARANQAPAQQAQPPQNRAYSQQAAPVYQQAPGQQYQPPLQNSQQPPTYARPQKSAARVLLKVVVILLIILILLGAGGFFAFRYVSGKINNAVNAGSGTNIQATATQAPLKTTPINQTVNYASVNITILNAQQTTSFADDQNASTTGALRLNLHAIQSETMNADFTNAPVYAYGESFALLLPGGKKVAIGAHKDITGPARKGDQTTWIDFPVSTGLNVNQMILQIGKDTEEQIQVPLTGHANLSQYQAKQSTPNLRVPFGGMFWTLTTVTNKLNDSGAQVDKGKRFLVLKFSIDNPGTDGLNAFPPDYIRLQYGGTTISLEQAAIGNAAAGTTNIPGEVSFLVPQGTTNATFILLPGHTPGTNNQATIPFQIPQK